MSRLKPATSKQIRLQINKWKGGITKTVSCIKKTDAKAKSQSVLEEIVQNPPRARVG